MHARVPCLVVLWGVVWAVGGCAVRPALSDPAPAAHPLFARAEQAYLRGEREQALELFRAYCLGFGHGEQGATARYWEGVILLELGQPELAEASFAIAIRESAQLRLRAQAITGLGDCAFARGDYEQAARQYRRAIDLGAPGARNDYALYRLGVAQQRAGDWGSGRNCYELLLRDYPHSPLAGLARRRLAFPLPGFHVEVAEFAEQTQAQLFSVRLRERGHPVRRLELPGRSPRWLVWAGPFATYAEAAAAAEALGGSLGRRLEVIP
ncbi:MAG: hypothetical protein KatS3mg102_1471 [Planctomycetota bacterium]|nr:MAG: hypothetical protein KatS3mg102_1471 [Planctomycetota bacterium]